MRHASDSTMTLPYRVTADVIVLHALDWLHSCTDVFTLYFSYQAGPGAAGLSEAEFEACISAASTALVNAFELCDNASYDESKQVNGRNDASHDHTTHSSTKHLTFVHFIMH
jgi:hypothetical protein